MPGPTGATNEFYLQFAISRPEGRFWWWVITIAFNWVVIWVVLSGEEVQTKALSFETEHSRAWGGTAAKNSHISFWTKRSYRTLHYLLVWINKLQVKIKWANEEKGFGGIFDIVSTELHLLLLIFVATDSPHTEKAYVHQAAQIRRIWLVYSLLWMYNHIIWIICHELWQSFDCSWGKGELCPPSVHLVNFNPRILLLRLHFCCKRLFRTSSLRKKLSSIHISL